MNGIVRYTGFSIDELERASVRVDSLSTSVIMSIAEGENVVRFLPAAEGAVSPFRITAMHYVKEIPGLDRVVVFACPKYEQKLPCPVCDLAARLGLSPLPIDRERARKYTAGLRVYANVIDRRHPEMGIRVLAFGKSIWDSLKAIRKSPRLGGDFTDPTEKGFDIIIQREGTGQTDTKYSVSADRTNRPLGESLEEINEVLQNIPSLEAHVVPHVPDDLAVALQMQARQAPAVLGSKPIVTAQGQAVLGAAGGPPVPMSAVGASFARSMNAVGNSRVPAAKDDDLDKPL